MKEIKDVMNMVSLVGKVHSKPRFDRKIDGVEYYKFELSVKRYSDYEDIILVTTARDHIAQIASADEGDEYLCVEGKLRSYNKHIDGRNRLVVHVEAVNYGDIRLNHNKAFQVYYNNIEVEGYICREPKIRKTPLTNKTICDTMVCVTEIVNGRKKDSYIPIISWDGLAEDMGNLPVGSHVTVKGRLQSREYTKEENGKQKKYTTTELSVGTYYKMLD